MVTSAWMVPSWSIVWLNRRDLALPGRLRLLPRDPGAWQRHGAAEALQQGGAYVILGRSSLGRIGKRSRVHPSPPRTDPGGYPAGVALSRHRSVAVVNSAP